jgi:hypothetical protein
MSIPLRAGADGPRVGNPPVIATPNLASLVGYIHGLGAAPTEITAVDSLIGGMAAVPLSMKAGYRYLIEMNLSCGTVHNYTLSRSFRPTYSTQPLGGAFPALNAMHEFRGWAATPTNGAVLWVGAANETTVTAFGHGNLVATELYIPATDQVAIEFGVRIAAVVAATDYINEFNCYAKVFELAGI